MAPARRAPGRRSPATLPGLALPGVRLVDDVPVASVLALPTAPGSDGAPPDVLGQVPGDLPAAVLLGREKATGEPGEVVVVPLPSSEAPERLLLVGTGSGSPRDLRTAGAALARRARSAGGLAVDLRVLRPDAEQLRGLVEGLLLASYRFSRKAQEPAERLREVSLVVPDADALRTGLEQATAVATATAAARDLVNTPSLEKTPQWLAEQAQALLDGVDVRVWDEKTLHDRGFGGVLAVGQGSARPPRFIEARWSGGADAGRAPHVVLVGKGITFDSGGLSLKPNDSMVAMKTDMGGAAAVLGTLAAVVALRLPLRVTALVAAAENMPSGGAQRPGDVIRHYGGRTVEVLNTDAEGRLVLADALAYADRDLAADVVVDVATLTGAMPVALGRRHAGMFASDDVLAAQLQAASESSGEPLWRMPLVEDYRHALDSPVADLRNIGQPRLKLQGGSITAALFLREFTGGRPWAHLDVAGPARSGSDDDEVTKGGTGYGVRLLTRWLEELAAAPSARRPSRRSA
ncbi:MAG TPA: leucyl aminopeptidase [Mycobacteriales bacterium]|nr:leucyl aminopeptidase [Mycobacteriales bacterium]